MRKNNYFKPHELKCRCGCGLDCTIFFKSRLNLAREYAKIPFNINSGARCKTHNKNVGGIEDSSHIKCVAADIRFSTDHEMIKILHGLTKAGFNRIGVNMSKKFVHADLDIDKPDAIWVYK
jgi:hypothetical protein